MSRCLGAQKFNLYQGSRVRVHEFATGPIFGVRLTEDFSRYVGMEESFTYGINNLRLKPFPEDRWVGFGARNYQAAINPVVHFTPRESVVRPYLLVGIGLTVYRPTDDAKRFARLPQNAALHADALALKYGPALVYGGGLKINASRRLGFRIEARGMLTQTPHFKLADFPVAPGNGS